MLEHGRLGESALGAEEGHFQRFLLCQAGRHDLAEQPHDLLVAQRAGIAFERAAQDFGLALRTIEIDRVAVSVLGNAGPLRESRSLIEQRVQLFVDRVDLRTQILEPGSRGGPGGAAGTHAALQSVDCTRRADSTPSMARSRPISASSGAPSASISVKANSPSERFSSSAILSPALARQVEI